MLRFAKDAATDLYNTDMVLYFLKHSIPNRPVPDDLIDTNVRIDFGKLRHLLVVGRQLNGNFDLLRDVIGEEQVDVRRVQSGFRSTKSPSRRISCRCCTTSGC